MCKTRVQRRRSAIDQILSRLDIFLVPLLAGIVKALVHCAHRDVGFSGKRADFRRLGERASVFSFSATSEPVSIRRGTLPRIRGATLSSADCACIDPARISSRTHHGCRQSLRSEHDPPSHPREPLSFRWWNMFFGCENVCYAKTYIINHLSST